MKSVSMPLIGCAMASTFHAEREHLQDGGSGKKAVSLYCVPRTALYLSSA